mmetsp:Transcript_96702/g.189931  ORF Transcript_96702/g.189931 Transcript_96702/m.189931 type:complete len:245 (+) Transcript_96702:76-810(+)
MAGLTARLLWIACFFSVLERVEAGGIADAVVTVVIQISLDTPGVGPGLLVGVATAILAYKLRKLMYFRHVLSGAEPRVRRAQARIQSLRLVKDENGSKNATRRKAQIEFTAIDAKGASFTVRQERFIKSALFARLEQGGQAEVAYFPEDVSKFELIDDVRERQCGRKTWALFVDFAVTGSILEALMIINGDGWALPIFAGVVAPFPLLGLGMYYFTGDGSAEVTPVESNLGSCDLPDNRPLMAA